MRVAERFTEPIATFERRLLAGLLADPGELDHARALVAVDDFETSALALVFDSFLRLREAERPITLIDLADDLLEAGDLERVGGRAALAKLTDEAITGAHVEADARRVAEAAADRRRSREAARIVANPRDREALERLNYVDATSLNGHAADAAMSEPLRLPDDVFVGTFAEVRNALRTYTGASAAHVFSATWAALATSIGNRVMGHFSGRVIAQNYLFNLGPVADHKSSAASGVLEILDVPCCAPTSAAGLFDEMAGRPALLLYADEWFELKAKLEYSGGGELRADLNKLWGAPPYHLRNRSRASKENKDRANRIDWPRLTLLVNGHVDGFWQKAAVNDLISGLLSRFAFFIGSNAISLPRTHAITAEARAYGADKQRSFSVLPGSEVTLSQTAELLWDEFAAREDERTKDLPGDRALMHKRVRDHVARLALVYTVDQGRVVIRDSDLDLAIAVGTYLAACADSLFDSYAPEQPAWEARQSYLEETILRILAKRPRATAREIRMLWPNSRNRPPMTLIRRTLEELRA